MKKVTFLLLTLLFSLELIYAQNYALDFDGMNDYVEITQDASLNMYNSSFTVELWVKSSQTHNTEVILFEYGEWETGTYQMTSDQQDQIKVSFHGRSSGDGAELTGDNWTDGTWHHFAGVFDNANNQLRLYKDGVLKVEVSETNAPGNATLSSYLGSRGGNTKFADMRMDELRIWDDVRTQSEIQNNMNIELTGSESNLVAYYNMNEGIGTSLMDHSSNSNNGTLENMDNSDWVADSPLSGTYSGGSGTSGDPYQIATTADLIELSNTSADWSAYFIQTADIAFNADETQVDWDGDGSATWDTEDQKGFLPIGNSSDKFTGSYNGDGHTIDYLYIDRASTDYIGLFGYINNATINSIGVTNVDITGDTYIGGLTGGSYSSSTISRCYVTGSVAAANDAGGFLGYNLSSSINNSYSTADVSRSSGEIGIYFASFCGYTNQGNIEYCYSNGNVVYEGGTDPTDKGFVGYDNSGSYTDNFFDKESNQSTASGATGLTSAQMKDYNSFTDETNSWLSSAWDFVTNPNDDVATNDYWDMDQDGTVNNGYPILSWQDGADNILQEYSGGSGTSGDPYQIATTDDLIELSNTSDDWDKHFIQTADIAFNADETQEDWNNSGSAGPVEGFSPIGDGTTNFTGDYDGDGYTIDYLYINRSSTDNIGLFGMIGDNVAINDLAVTNVDITGNRYTGVLCGRIDGLNSLIDNCETSGVLSGLVSCGGMVGRGNGSISNSSSSVTVNASIISDDWSDTGGLIGDAKGTISNCYVTGNVTAEGRNTGGLAGWVREGITIEQCFTTGDVTINSSNSTGEAGGLVGSYSGTSQIINSYATGTISVDNSGNGGVGGLVGQLTDNPSIENCYFSGEVINTSGNIGGLIGEFEYSSDAPALTNNLWNNSINSSINGIGNDSDNGVTGKTTAELQDIATFTSTSTTGLTSAWDFVNDPNDDGANNDYWDISSSINDGYPYLTKENSNDPLPVNLLSFTGERKAKSIVELHWSTASELNNDRFEIQRSQNGHDFVTIGEVNGAGNSNQVLKYEFTDVEAPEETLYYRLKQIDYNGQYKYSEIVVIHKESSLQTGELSIYPNPVSGTVNLKFPEYKGDMQLEVFDMSGRKIYTTQVCDQYSININTQQWPEGVYMVICKNRNMLLQQRIVKQ